MTVLRYFADVPNAAQSNPAALTLSGTFNRFNATGTWASNDSGGQGVFLEVTGSGLGWDTSPFPPALTGFISTVRQYNRSGDQVTLLSSVILAPGFNTSPTENLSQPTVEIVAPIFSGADRIYGAEGWDDFFGGDSNDSIYGGGGIDNVNGDDGDDFLVCGSGDDDSEGGSGNDTIWGGEVGSLNGDAFDQLVGQGGDDVIHLSGGGTADGDDGNDRLYAGSLAGTLSGDAGNDSLEGGAQNDALDGGTQSDTIYGGDGADAIDGDGGGSDVPEAEYGNDLIYGGKGNDTVLANAGNDTVFGGQGADLLGYINPANAGAERGDDSFYGGGGRDTLSGGAGSDILFGGGGRDQFVFNQFFGTCTIADFVTKTQNGTSYDRVDFRAMVPLGEASSFQQFKSFCTEETGVPVFGTNVIYDKDGDGVNAIVFWGLEISDFGNRDIVFV